MDEPMRELRAGMRVGLLGGSFDPAHAGHVHIAREALKRFGLDRVVLLASPGNPLKANPPAPLEVRLAQARALADHPAILVSGIEARLGTRLTADTLTRLVALHPGVRFVWLMGADNLAQLHRWGRWRTILRTMPVGVLARPGHGLVAGWAPAARIFRGARLPVREARLLPLQAPPAWCYVPVPMVRLSSSEIRAARNGG
ncbi:nicotinate-nucleotide adenylyltransferase [Citreimonas sp.]|uniref:nicotinate-nucleotide adenylyltransferase n=1 Tax=Citreimonas sp. TaxID=3036715 RepID=UPI004059905E